MTRFILLLFLLFSFQSVLQAQIADDMIGHASYYGREFRGKNTASGEKYLPEKLTAAHKTLPLGTYVRVTNLDNDKTVIVRINDRGPYVRGRIIDLSTAAASVLGYVQKGTAKVSLEIVNGPDEDIATTTQREPDHFYQLTPMDSAKTFGIKIISYQIQKDLFALSNELTNRYKLPVFIQTVKLVEGTLYRVFVGSFTTKEEAEHEMKRVKTDYKDAYVISYVNFK